VCVYAKKETSVERADTKAANDIGIQNNIWYISWDIAWQQKEVSLG